MARQVIVAVWCDVCQENELQTEGDELTPIQVGNTKARVPALCEAHRKEFYDPFMEMLGLAAFADSLSSQPKPGKKQQSLLAPNPGEEPGVACIFPGCEDVLKNRGSLMGHTKGMHGIRLPELLAQGDGKLYDTSGAVIWEIPDAPQVTDWKCPEKGCKVHYTYPANTRPSTAGAVHLRVGHGIT